MWRTRTVFSTATLKWMVTLACIVPAGGAAADFNSMGSGPAGSWPEENAPGANELSPGYAAAPPEILSGNELVSLSKKNGYDLASTMVAAERLREVAVRERDLIRLSCIQDHLLQMKLVKRVADDALVALDRPDVREDELRLRHEFRSVEMGNEQMARIHVEMMECAGAETPIVQEGEGPSGVRPSGAGDPTAVGVNTAMPDRPASASPYM